MTREEKVFQMALAIAPTIANAGITLQENLVQQGHDPQKCRIGDDTIHNAFGKLLKIWAEAFVDELVGEA